MTKKFIEKIPIRKNYFYFIDPVQVEKGALDTFDPVTRESIRYKHIMATLDWKTCKKCIDMHGKIYRIEDVFGKTPSLHPNCRCDFVAMEALLAGQATKNRLEGADYWLKYFKKLPDYYVTEDETIAAGWRKGKPPRKFVPDKMIGGSVYENTNGHLPDAPGRVWYEADINYYEGKRNGHRILWSNDGLMFVTYNHYLTFYEII